MQEKSVCVCVRVPSQLSVLFNKSDLNLRKTY